MHKRLWSHGCRDKALSKPYMRSGGHRRVQTILQTKMCSLAMNYKDMPSMISECYRKCDASVKNNTFWDRQFAREQRLSQMPRAG